jgi:hypothetical protein
VIKTLYPAIFNTVPLTGPSPFDSLSLTIAVLNTVYPKVIITKPANTIDKSFPEALRPDLVELVSGGLPGSFRREVHAIQRTRSNKILLNDGVWKEGGSDLLNKKLVKTVYG